MVSSRKDVYGHEDETGSSGELGESLPSRPRHFNFSPQFACGMLWDFVLEDSTSKGSVNSFTNILMSIFAGRSRHRGLRHHECFVHNAASA
jgi:hypothetical protein